MSRPTLDQLAGRLLLRLRVALLHAHPLALLATLLCLGVLGTWLWLMHAVVKLEDERPLWRAQARAAAAHARAQAHEVAPVSTPAAAPDALAAFYATLGRRERVEQQLKTLFDLAAQNGLTLAQGDYKAGYERNAQLRTYQVNLPVKGSYAAIWQFAFGALRAIPFASLDDIGFRRDDVKDAQVEARLRLTLYLNDAEGKR